jgi:organic radical activating enzyme
MKFIKDKGKRQPTKLDEFVNKNKSYCPMAFREIYVDNAGQYRLCCHATQREDLKKYQDNNTLPFEYFRSDEMEQIRNDMFLGKPITGCERCYEMEKRSGHSYRTDKYLKKYGVVDDVDQINLKLRINGSACNLGCYMCFPYNSSTRRNELKAAFGDAYKKIEGFNKEYKAVKHDQWENMVQDIMDNIHLVNYINMTGGEPLQLPKHWEFMDRIPEEHAKHIKVGYDTNLTKLRWKNHSIFDLADKFQEISLGVSCDHYGERLKWIRYPIDVEEFESNLIEAKSLVKKLNCTVSLLNIDDLHEIARYYRRKFDVEVTFHNIARGPEMLSICNLPGHLKEKYTRLYKDFPYVLEELQKVPHSKGSLEQMKSYCDRLSQHRNFDWRKLWPNFLT